MAETPPIEVGQVWRNKKSGKTIRVTRIERLPHGADISWVTISGKGPRSGIRWSVPWWNVFELVGREKDRPSECCGACPPIAGGGYDCTCSDNPRCANR
jgi:hypothetical protein